MTLGTTDIEEIRKRLKKIDGSIKNTAAKGGITEQVVHKMFKGENVEQDTIDAFFRGLESLEAAYEEQRQLNSLRAKGLLATTPAADLSGVAA